MKSIKILPAISLILIFSCQLFAQKITPGEYEFGLKLAYDSKTNKLTGYFESYSGWDETTKKARFSCIFYLEGQMGGNSSEIKTYYPTQNVDEIVQGELKLITKKSIGIKLDDEHGGCWNVHHFADKPEKFELEKAYGWIQIRYVESEKTYFYLDKSEDTKLKSYLVKSDFVCVE
ncbi:MAG: hypothetical protein ACKVOU_00910, partial [Cytophagales bacterium]